VVIYGERGCARPAFSSLPVTPDGALRLLKRFRTRLLCRKCYEKTNSIECGLQSVGKVLSVREVKKPKGVEYDVKLICGHSRVLCMSVREPDEPKPVVLLMPGATEGDE
jgi:hypothetical protein